MITIFFTFLQSKYGRPVLIAVGVIAFVASFAFDQQRRGAQKWSAKMEKAVQHDLKKAGGAGARSRTGIAGVRDPYTASDDSLSP